MAHSSGSGHGGKNHFDVGAVGSGTSEWAQVSQLNKDILFVNPKWKDVSDNSGTTVNQNLYNIVANTNAVSSSNELTLSHHMNAYNGRAEGVEVWYYAGDFKGKDAATRISAAIAKATGMVNRGAKATTDLYVIANTNATCLLIEWCFVDNPTDFNKFNKNRIAAINAACDVLGIAKVGGAASSGKPSTPAPSNSKFHTTTGKYIQAKDDYFYKEKELNTKSSVNIKAGQVVYADQVVVETGRDGTKYYRGAWQLGNTLLYFSLNKNIINKA